MQKYEESFESFLENFKNTVSKLGFKNSIQKDYILKILYFNDEHLSAEQIANIAKTEYKVDMGIATVYRTVKFFEELNIINSLDIGDGAKRYELNLSLHHDHMICTSCNKIIEFNDDVIEKQQLKVAKDNSFILSDHIMTIYGVCEDCQ
ncbi:transcriptional repressor [Malaciobacter halophilus]|uniref:Ferric uptake regulation protein n=1 Tax=Malaciobacter halophilus TaxID=197482 RepID=A0A2N1J004_9BACT|nr:transcriptional repressor [Malaciobacter halophilus]AXH10438.1 transcriptional regulator, Fur family [Malaciobacter halophilus]PKI79872.1 transcriptional repressor [Malaciobacter halophilus]